MSAIITAHKTILRALGCSEGWELDSPMAPNKAIFRDDDGQSETSVSFSARDTAEIIAVRTDTGLVLTEQVDLSGIDEWNDSVVARICDTADRLWNDLW